MSAISIVRDHDEAVSLSTWGAFWRSRLLVWVSGCVALLVMGTSGSEPISKTLITDLLCETSEVTIDLSAVHSDYTIWASPAAKNANFLYFHYATLFPRGIFARQTALS